MTPNEGEPGDVGDFFELVLDAELLGSLEWSIEARVSRGDTPDQAL